MDPDAGASRPKDKTDGRDKMREHGCRTREILQEATVPLKKVKVSLGKILNPTLVKE